MEKQIIDTPTVKIEAPPKPPIFRLIKKIEAQRKKQEAPKK